MADQEDWVAQLLEASIRSSGLSERRLEKRLGWKKGTLGRVLESGSSLERQQVLDILEVLRRESAAPGTADETGGGIVGELLGRFQRLGHMPDDREEPAGAPHGTELEKMVEEVLLEAFGSSLGEHEPDEE